MKRLLTVLTLGVLAACSADPPPPGATLSVVVVDLPPGAVAAVHLTGPGVDMRLDGAKLLDDVAPGRYTLDIEPVRLADERTSYPTVARVDVDATAGHTTELTARYGVVVPDTTRVLDAANPGITSDPALPELVFTPGTTLEPGQVLVSGVGPKTPEGLLRKVADVRPAADGVHVRTEPATLFDAVPEGSVLVDHQVLGDASVHNFHGAPPGKVDASFDVGKGANCANGLSGTLGLTWFPYIHLDMKWKKVLGVPLYPERASFAVGMHREIGGQFTQGTAFSCGFEGAFPPVPYPLGTFTVMVGPVPVVFTVGARFVGSLKLSSEAETTYSFDADEKLEVGASYTGRKAEVHVDLPVPDRVPESSGSVQVSAKVGIRLSVDLYGVTGPYVDLTTGFRAGVQPPVVCSGVYGDLGWEFEHAASFEVPDFVKRERERLPRAADNCPLETDKDVKLVQHRKTVTLADYRWMVGTWERRINSPDSGKLLDKETLVVAPDGRATYTTQSFIEIEYGEPITCSGPLRFNDSGVLVFDTGQGPPGYMDLCRMPAMPIAYVPAVPGGDRENVDWFSPLHNRGFYRVG